VRYLLALLRQINPRNFNGLISGDIMCAPWVMKHFRSFHPSVNIGAITSKDFPNVSTDLLQGTYDAVSHLIEVHGRRRIVCVRGPDQSDSNGRYDRYVEALRAHGLSLDASLVSDRYSWDKAEALAREFIHALLDRGDIEFDAVFGANDFLAIGALNALRERGVQVPYDVSVIGIDDRIEAHNSIPPLSSVHQPCYEMGRRGVELVLAQLRGETAPALETIPSELALHTSCGCMSPAMRHTALTEEAAWPLGPGEGAEHAAANRQRALTEMAAALAGDSTAEQVWEAFFDEIDRRKSAGFIPVLGRSLNRSVAAGGDPLVWQNALSVLRRQAHRELADSPETLARAENLWHMARVLATDAACSAERRRQMQVEQRQRELAAVGQAIMTTLNMDALVEVLVREIPRLGIPACYLTLHDGPAWPPETMRLILAFNARGRLALEAEGLRFPASQLLPEGILSGEERLALLVKPLYFQEEHLGSVIFQIGPRDGKIYQALAGIISSALKGGMLVQQVQRHARELEQSYQALRANQERLLISEKMASLGRLTAGIVHEINSPLAAARTSLARMDKLVGEYLSSIDDPAVTPADHREIAREMSHSVQLAAKAAERVADFTRGIKAQTRNLGPSEPLRFNAVPVIKDALLLLQHALREGQCTARLDPATDVMELYGAPGQLARVVTNLVINAIDATRAKGGGVIGVRLEPAGEGIVLHVQDEGCGISEEILSKIFDPLFTTKPFGESAGLGLTIVHDIVTGEFGGSVEVLSQVGIGTTFTLRFVDAARAGKNVAGSAGLE
jgi:C4-dicarboxylate-specific signal transduction histidine kinase